MEDADLSRPYGQVATATIASKLGRSCATVYACGETLGLIAVHVNRVIQKMRDDGLISLKRRQLTILDAERLKAIAGFDPNYLHLDRRK